MQRTQSWSNISQIGRQLPGGERQSGPLHMSWNSPSSSSGNTVGEGEKDPAPKSAQQASIWEIQHSLLSFHCHPFLLPSVAQEYRKQVALRRK